jgi:hypothetical protein
MNLCLIRYGYPFTVIEIDNKQEYLEVLGNKESPCVTVKGILGTLLVSGNWFPVHLDYRLFELPHFVAIVAGVLDMPIAESNYIFKKC